MTRSIIRASTTAAFACTLLTLSYPGQAETIIGRWCDRWLPSTAQYNNVITIRLNSDGLAETHLLFHDGSEMIQEVHEVSGTEFAVADSTSGDRYRIVATSGELQLIDNDGLIRVAQRLENTPTAGECGF